MLSQKQLLDKVKTENILDFLRVNNNEIKYSTNFILVYGSLRNNQYNFNRIKAELGSDSLIYIADFDIKGLMMYDLGQYPAVTKAEYPKLQIKAELMYCSAEAYSTIYSMELGAGYKVSKETVYIYNPGAANDWFKSSPAVFDIYIADASLQNQIKRNNCNIVPQGDWLKYKEAISAPINLTELNKVDRLFVSKQK